MTVVPETAYFDRSRTIVTGRGSEFESPGDEHYTAFSSPRTESGGPFDLEQFVIAVADRHLGDAGDVADFGLGDLLVGQ